MVQNVPSILDRLRGEASVLRQLGVCRLAIFGSAVREQISETSDIDLLVEIAPKTFNTYMGVKEHLEEKFGRRIDLVLFGAVKPALRENITRDAIDVPLG